MNGSLFFSSSGRFSCCPSYVGGEHVAGPRHIPLGERHFLALVVADDDLHIARRRRLGHLRDDLIVGPTVHRERLPAVGDMALARAQVCTRRRRCIRAAPALIQGAPVAHPSRIGARR